MTPGSDHGSRVIPSLIPDVRRTSQIHMQDVCVRYTNRISVSQLTTLPHGMACQCARTFETHSIRPCVPENAWTNGAAKSGWGGVGTQTCEPPDQWMAVTFEYREDIIGMTSAYHCQCCSCTPETQMAHQQRGHRGYRIGIPNN